MPKTQFLRLRLAYFFPWMLLPCKCRGALWAEAGEICYCPLLVLYCSSRDCPMLEGCLWGHDCSAPQVSALVGHFLVCSPGSSQLLSGVGLALLWTWAGQTLLLPEKKKEHLAEKILTETVHFKILFSGFSWGKKQFGLCFFLSLSGCSTAL